MLIVTHQRPIRDLQSDLDAAEPDEREEMNDQSTNKDDYIILDRVGESLEVELSGARVVV